LCRKVPKRSLASLDKGVVWVENQGDVKNIIAFMFFCVFLHFL